MGLGVKCFGLLGKKYFESLSFNYTAPAGPSPGRMKIVVLEGT